MNPFLRSRGSLLEGEDMNYQLPGGGGVRGIDPRVSTRGLVALNAELERTLITRPTAGLFSRVALAAFTDLAQGLERTSGLELHGPDPVPRRRGNRASRGAPHRRHALRHAVRPASLGQPARAGAGPVRGRR
jgi:hypothetical protein